MQRGARVALCVAEKPSVAKAISELLSNGRFNKVSPPAFKSNLFLGLGINIQTKIIKQRFLAVFVAQRVQVRR